MPFKYQLHTTPMLPYWHFLLHKAPNWCSENSPVFSLFSTLHLAPCLIFFLSEFSPHGRGRHPLQGSGAFKVDKDIGSRRKKKAAIRRRIGRRTLTWDAIFITYLHLFIIHHQKHRSQKRRIS